MNQLTERPIGFALVQIEGRTPHQISEGMGIVCDCVANTNAVIDCLFSGFVIASVGTMSFHTKHPEFEIQRVVEEIRKKMPENLRLVWGVHHGAFGNIGSSARFSYTFIIPDFMAAFSSLQKLPLGASLRI
jgi:hypothetical protein